MEKVKIGLVLVLLLCIQYSFAQEKRISLDFRNESMPSALKKIAQAGDQKISFSYEDVVPYKVNTNVQNKTVIETLQQILAGTPLLYKERGQFITVYLDPQSSVARAKRNQCFVYGRVLDGGRGLRCVSKILPEEW